MIVVSNSSPLISLSAIRQSHLLPALFQEIIIPQAVYDEIVFGEDRAGTSEVKNADWIQTQRVKNSRAAKQLAASAKLDLGESEAIVLARELKADHLLLDDLAARKAAHRKRLPVTGTLGVLLLAKNAGLIPEVAAPMRELIAAGKYVDPIVYREILLKAGEL